MESNIQAIRPTESPAAIMQRCLAVIERLQKSTKPDDIMECIKLAAVVEEQAKILSAQCLVARTKALEALHLPAVA